VFVRAFEERNCICPPTLVTIARGKSKSGVANVRKTFFTINGGWVTAKPLLKKTKLKTANF
jgi:hypothetical protein